jgi:hypothetical protein
MASGPSYRKPLKLGAVKDGCTTARQAACYEGAHVNWCYDQRGRCIRHIMGVPNLNTAKERHDCNLWELANPRWDGGYFEQLFPEATPGEGDMCRGPVVWPPGPRPGTPTGSRPPVGQDPQHGPPAWAEENSLQNWQRPLGGAEWLRLGDSVQNGRQQAASREAALAAGAAAEAVLLMAGPPASSTRSKQRQQ